MDDEDKFRKDFLEDLHKSMEDRLKEAAKRAKEAKNNPQEYQSYHPIPLIKTSFSDNSYFPLEWGKLDLVEIDPVYRKEVSGLAPPVYKNKEVIWKIKEFIGADRPQLLNHFAPFVSSLDVNKPKSFEDGTISLQNIVSSLEDFAYDAYFTDIHIYRGVDRTAEDENLQTKLIPNDNYLFVAIGDLGEDSADDFHKAFGLIPKEKFGVLEVTINPYLLK